VKEDKQLKIGDKTYKSRLIVGTGKYKELEVMARALEESGTEMVTVAIRRVNLDKVGSGETLMDYIDTEKMEILPNTAGCYNVEDAIRTAHLARAAGISDKIKLEIIGDEKTLMPDVVGLLEATRVLVDEGFVVMPYTNDDIITAKRLEDLGASVIMPLGSPIGSGQGVLNPLNIKLILEAVSVPVIVDAGVGTASDATIAMELGADGVLINTSIAGADDPVNMARAMKLAVESGRLAYLSGRIPRKSYATASSPQEGLIE